MDPNHATNQFLSQTVHIALQLVLFTAVFVPLER